MMIDRKTVLSLALLMALPQFCFAVSNVPQKGVVLPKSVMSSSVINHGLLNIIQVINKVQAAGYSSIYEVKFDDGRYKVKALNAKGKKVKLHVNAATGVISGDKKWF